MRPWLIPFVAGGGKGWNSPLAVCVWQSHNKQADGVRLWCTEDLMKDVPPPPLREQAFKATLGTGLVCAAVQHGKPMRRARCGDGPTPVTRGSTRAPYPLPHGPLDSTLLRPGGARYTPSCLDVYGMAMFGCRATRPSGFFFRRHFVHGARQSTSKARGVPRTTSRATRG